MLVCLCNNINETKLARAKAHGARSPHQAYQLLGCAVRCGTCCKQACAILRA